jgi:hypothetical protein
MAVSLYDLSVTTYLQILGAMEGFLSKGLAHRQESKIDPNSILDERLYDDMRPFSFQVWNTVHQSLGAVRGVREGAFGPTPPIPAPMDYAGLQKLVSDSQQKLRRLTREEIEALQGKDVAYVGGA